MQTLSNNISTKNALSSTSLTASGVGGTIDCFGNGSETFDSALVVANVGAIVGAPVVAVSVEESEDGVTFTNASGGGLTTVSGNASYVFQVNRSKRYIRLSVTITGGTTPTVAIGATAILTNWATPYPLI